MVTKEVTLSLPRLGVLYMLNRSTASNLKFVHRRALSPLLPVVFM
jgi:hypothetical protein